MKPIKRIFLWLLLILLALAALGYAVTLIERPGYVLLAYKGFRYESSLWGTLALLATLWVLLYVVRLTWRLLTASGRVANPWSRRNRNRRAQMSAEQGLLDLSEGRWERALRHLRRAAEAESQPLMHYLGAARAAQELGRYAECDGLLERALTRQPQAELAIALAHAELQVARGESAAALETLQVMRERHPRHRQVLRQLQALYEQQGDWSALLGLLPELRKNKALAESELLELERRAWRARLAVAGQSALAAGEAGLQPLTHAWQQLSKAQRQEPLLLLAYAEQLRSLGAEQDAEELLRSALKRHYDASLVTLYGTLCGKDLQAQLQACEGWLKQQPDDPQLLLALGRLSLQNRLWDKARGYFEASLAQSRSASACAELARLLAHLGEVGRSNQLFQEGLSLLEHPLPSLPLPELR
jgi:HemY protein